MRQNTKKSSAARKGRTKCKSPKGSNAPSAKGKEKGSKRPSSDATVDDLAIIAIALQHQVADDGTNEILSLSYCVRQNAKRQGGFIDLRGEKPLTLGKLIAHILDSAKGVVFKRYPKGSFVISSQTDLLLDWLQDGEIQREGLSAKGRTFFYRITPLCVHRPTPYGKYRDDYLWLVDSRNLGPSQDGVAELESWFGRSPSASPAEGNWQSSYDSDRAQHETFAKEAADLLANFAYGVAEVTFTCIGTATLYSTLGALAEAFFVEDVSTTGADLHQILGRESITTDEGKGGTALLRRLHLRETLATECYHGGRNESFAFGPTRTDEWIDYDLCSAYPTALASIGSPAWETAFDTTTPSDFTGQVLGFAHVHFEFPQSVRFPTLPVRAPGKLIFPLSGESYATAPEIALARSLGAKLTILDGFVIPCNAGEKPYLPTIQKSLEYREAAMKAGNDLATKLHKAIANSIPGKMGQGLPPKRDAVDQSRKMPPCGITQAFLAAHITGMIRGTVGEILNRLPRSTTVISVTTDGFITNSTQAVVMAACNGPLAKTLSDTRQSLGGGRLILEEKRRAQRLLPIRNRVIATLTPRPGWNLILSRSGIQPPRQCRSTAQKNEWLRSKFRKRTPDLRLTQESWRQIADRSRSDFQVGLEYDFDRQLVYESMQSLGGSKHGSFSSRPWQSLEDYLLAEAAFAEFRKSSCLRTKDDLDLFADHMKIQHARSLKNNPAPTGPHSFLMRAKRTFLRALVRGDLGLAPYESVPRKELCQRINQALATSTDKEHLEVTLNDLKNAARCESTYATGTIPQTRQVEDFFERMSTAFPGFTMEELYTPPASWEQKGNKMHFSYLWKTAFLFRNPLINIAL
jgi:hypothetical protein